MIVGGVFPQRGSAPSDEQFAPTLDLITLDAQSNPSGVFGDTVKIYDRAGRRWCEYGFARDGAREQVGSCPKKLRLAFPENSRFFKLVATSTHWYEVELDSATGETGFLRIDDPFLKRDGIGLRLLLSPFIKFDAENNPLLDAPGGAPLIVSTGEAGFKAAAIEGDWMQIEIPAKGADRDAPGKMGWIRWRKDNRLLVSFGYR